MLCVHIVVNGTIAIDANLVSRYSPLSAMPQANEKDSDTPRGDRAPVLVRITSTLRKFDGDTTEGDPVETIEGAEDVPLDSLPADVQATLLIKD